MWSSSSWGCSCAILGESAIWAGGKVRLVLVSLSFPRIKFPTTKHLKSSLLSKYCLTHCKTTLQFRPTNLWMQYWLENITAIIPHVLYLYPKMARTTTAQQRASPALKERQERWDAAWWLDPGKVTALDHHSCEDWLFGTSKTEFEKNQAWIFFPLVYSMQGHSTILWIDICHRLWHNDMSHFLPVWDSSLRVWYKLLFAACLYERANALQIVCFEWNRGVVLYHAAL